MSELTRGEIETLIDDLIVAHPLYTPQLRALREQSLSKEAVRDEVLEEVARRGIKLPIREEWDGQNYLVDANGKVVSKETLANILLHALKREPNAAAHQQSKGNVHE